VPPPPLDKDGNPIVAEDGSNMETSMAPTVDELMKQLEKLNAELIKLKTKDKKDKKKRNKSSYNAMSFSYNNMPSSMAYTSIPIDKAPYFDGTNYNQWKHCMKSYLYFISPEVW
jgi:hypothetical protein